MANAARRRPFFAPMTMSEEPVYRASTFKLEKSPAAWQVALARLPNAPAGYILRGAKADKSRWSRMYAANAQQARDLAAELRYDTGLGLGGNESYPQVFAPFGGFADDTPVKDSRVKMPEIPGIGFEAKNALYAVMKPMMN